MIEIKNVTKIYGNKAALVDINLTFEKGQIIGLFGSNGTGKTTLMKAIMDLISINKGEILVDGKPVTKSTYKDLIYVSEEGTLFSDMNAMEHAEFFEVHFPKFNTKRFNKLIEVFDIDAKVKVAKFSKGQKSRLEVILGVCKGGKYLLLDEPFLGNDIFTRNDFVKILASFMEEDGIIVIATHILKDIDKFIDRAIVMKYSLIGADFTMDEIKEKGITFDECIKKIYNYTEDRIIEALE